MKIKLLVSMVFVFVLFSCANKQNVPPPNPYRGIVPFGPDTYSLSLSGIKGGSSRARTVALRKANEFCKLKNQEFMPIRDKTGGWSYTIVFRCLNPDDPELVRPKPDLEPAVVVEDKKQ